MEINFEFRKERKLGEIVQDFINLVRMVFGHFFQTILRLSVVPLCLMLILIYYGTTKVNLTTDQDWTGNRDFIIIGIIVFFALLVVSMVFFGLAIEYFILLKNKRSTNFGTQEVWDAFVQNLRKYFTFFLVSMVSMLILVIPVLLAMGLLIFIPFIGNFAVGILSAFISVWYFCAFVFYRENYMEAGTALQQTFTIQKKKIFDYSVSSYIVGFVFQGILLMLTIIPMLIIGIIAYNSIGFDDTFFETFLGRMLTSVGVTLVLLLYIIYYMFSVLVSGIIYETAKEVTYGENVYERIEQLGKGNDA